MTRAERASFELRARRTGEGRRPRSSSGFTIIAAALCLLPASAASAWEWGLRLDGTVAVPLTEPQNQHYSLGGSPWLKVAAGLSWVDFHASLGYVGLAPRSNNDTGSAIVVGGGPRLKLPRLKYRVSPWIDMDLLYAHTGPLDRFAFAVGAGLSVPLDDRRMWFASLVLRYFQIAQPGNAGINEADAKILMVGLEFEWAARPNQAAAVVKQTKPVVRQAEPVVAVAARQEIKCEPDTDHDGVLDRVDRCPFEAGPAATAGCPDSDGDGVADVDDQCPTKAGSAANHGCPAHDLVEMTGKKLEIRQKVHFATGSFEILTESNQLLDEVVALMKDASGLRFRIEGHADDQGTADHNNTLSTARANSVRDYLVKQGVKPERLEAVGYGQERPIDKNDTEVGRKNNRRVEFVIIEQGDAK